MTESTSIGSATSIAPKTWEEFETIFKPVPPEYHGPDEQVPLMHDIHNDMSHVEYIFNRRPGKVWTLLDVDGRQVVANGLHRVNRIGYFIAETDYTGRDCEFLYDEEDSVDQESGVFLRGGALVTLEDGTRLMAQECILRPGGRVEFTPQSKLHPEAKETVFFLDSRTSDSDHGRDTEFEDLASILFEKTDFMCMLKASQAIPMRRGSSFDLEPLERFLNPVVQTFPQDGRESSNCLRQIANASFSQLRQSVLANNYTTIAGCENINEVALADLLSAYDSRPCFYSESPKLRLEAITEQGFNEFQRVALQVLKAHAATDAFAQGETETQTTEVIEVTRLRQTQS